MKSVNKIILLSCLFCYVAGLYYIAQYYFENLAEVIDIKYFYLTLVVYTILAIAITIFIHRQNVAHAKDVGEQMQKLGNIHAVVGQIDSLASRYGYVANADKAVKDAFTLLSRKIGSLTPGIFASNAAQSTLSGIIERVGQALDNVEQAHGDEQQSLGSELLKVIRQAIDAVDQLRNSTIK